MRQQFKIIYPTSKFVSAARIFVWALDAASDNYGPEPTTLAEAIRLLEDIGWVTFTNAITSFLTTWDANQPIKHWDLFTGEVSFL